jgi:hypothetical protein
VARTIERFPEVTVDRLVLCGSIVRRDYPWTRVIHESKQVPEVLNDYGRMDLWAGIVRWFVADAGPSGTEGFIDNASGLVIQREHADFTHSDYFYDLNYDKTWIPFLNGLDPAPLAASQSFSIASRVGTSARKLPTVRPVHFQLRSGSELILTPSI